MNRLSAEPADRKASRSALPAVTIGALVVLATFSCVEALSDAFRGIDSAGLSFMLAHRTSWRTSTARTITSSGTSPLLFPVVALTGVFVWRRTGHWVPGVAAVPVVGAGVLSRLGLSQLVGDPRPPTADWLVSVRGFSFPSGHAATASLTAGALAWLFAQAVDTATVRVAVMLVCASWALLVSLSRVYLGVHWISDIIGSWLLAGIWLTALRILVPLPRPLPMPRADSRGR